VSIPSPRCCWPRDGIADLGFAWMAWIIDPGKNALAIMQLKD
jgi:hypothetical protein